MAGQADAIGDRKSAIVNRKFREGIALVITLILLSVTLFMALAFLAISRRERGSVTTATDTATARLAADSALAQAQAQIVASIFATTNPYNYSLLISTNYINVNGFTNGVANPLNVNYDFVAGGSLPLNAGQLEQNIANLYLSPRPPVFITTNRVTGANEFRFYLDLNRDGRFEDSGTVSNVDIGLSGLPFTNGTIAEIGDPQWVGVLERPDAPHGPNNKFLSRFAFIALPVGNSLDLNAIHNQVFDEPASPSPATISVNPNSANSDVFFRNQGVGTWEINLAAFLTDLNTNQWDTTAAGYNYFQPGSANTGFAFEDARALLAYRYNNNYNTLASAQAMFGANGFNAFQNDGIDGYSDGTLQTTLDTNADFFVADNANLPWAGADNTNHFFDLSADLFDPTKTEKGVVAPALGFTDHLLNAGTNVTTYDRYTFYRLLSQLGTDSQPESGKMNLNYDNLDANGNVVPGAETNLFAWTPIRFFTNAADRMLRTYSAKWFQADPTNYLETYYGIVPTYYVDGSGFGVTNVSAFGMTNQIPSFGVTDIPVYVNGRYVYSSAIQRVLQLAANIYDASTNRFYPPDFAIPMPTLFEPVFSKTVNANVFITNFVEYITGNFNPLSVEALTNTFALDLSNPNDLANLQPFSFVYGVPIIVGAKKGLPNFNAFSMESVFQITRKLQLTRASTNTPVSDYKINQAFNCSLSNLFAVECWNSYITNYARPTTIWVADRILMGLTNDDPNVSPQPLWPPGLNTTLFASITTNNWTGIGLTTPMNANSFLLTSPTNLIAIGLPTATYLFNPATFNGNLHFQPIINNQTTFQNPSGMFQPHWGLTATNDLQVVLIDNITGRAIDYVQLHGPIMNRDLTAEILSISNSQAPSSMWLTNFVSSGTLPGQSLPSGVEAQLVASEMFNSSLYKGQSPEAVQPFIDGFRKFLNLTPLEFNPSSYGATNLEIQSVYTPTATPVQIINWQANDPLVHYLASDLFDSNAAKGKILQNGATTNFITATPNDRYQPWGKSSQMGSVANVDQNPSNLAFKDPLALSSDHWDFPTNKFPTVGWLGRVHRGTPWQTVYLKSADILTRVNSSGANIGTNTWMNWTGNFNTNDAVNASPVQDRALFDIFTTALNDNATRGRLPINVAANPNDPAAGLAAWSALLSGVTVLHNNLSDAAFLQPPSNGGGPRGGNQASSSAPALSYTNLVINPAGLNGTNSPLGQLVVSINSTRANTNLFPQQTFGTKFGVGDVLATPAFTDLSPFLNRDAVQLTNGISDELYEWLPQQTMGLLTVSTTPRYVIYSYGQTLKPAPNGIDVNSTTAAGTPIFGMVTNYQVVSEIATRAVVQVNTVLTTNTSVIPNIVTTNYSTTVEQFNVLPPD